MHTHAYLTFMVDGNVVIKDAADSDYAIGGHYRPRKDLAGSPKLRSPIHICARVD